MLFGMTGKSGTRLAVGMAAGLLAFGWNYSFYVSGDESKLPLGNLLLYAVAARMGVAATCVACACSLLPGLALFGGWFYAGRTALLCILGSSLAARCPRLPLHVLVFVCWSSVFAPVALALRSLAYLGFAAWSREYLFFSGLADCLSALAAATLVDFFPWPLSGAAWRDHLRQTPKACASIALLVTFALFYFSVLADPRGLNDFAYAEGLGLLALSFAIAMIWPFLPMAAGAGRAVAFFLPLMVWLPAGFIWQRPADPRPNLILIVLDTLRADHLGIYGYERDTSPALDAFARENLTFDQAISPAPWTPSAVASMFTGFYASVHRMMPEDSRERARGGYSMLDPSLDTLAERLAAAGYGTIGISPNPWISREFNYQQGFEVFGYFDRVRAGDVTDRGIEAIESALAAKEHPPAPFFLYLHYLDPHDPYSPPGEFARKYSGPLAASQFSYSAEMQKKMNLYDGEISYLDVELGRFLGYLRSKPFYDQLKIVIVGDHGEQFRERGELGHGYRLYSEEVRVPLIVKSGRPQDRGRRVSEPVSLVDLYGTFLSFAGLPAAAGSGQFSLLDQGAIASRPGVLMEIRRMHDQKGFVDKEGRKIIFETDYELADPSWESSDARWKSGARLAGVFDSRVDPREEESLGDPALSEGLSASFWSTYRALPKDRYGSREGQELSDQTIERLRSLGYVP